VSFRPPVGYLDEEMLGVVSLSGSRQRADYEPNFLGKCRMIGAKRFEGGQDVDGRFKAKSICTLLGDGSI